MSINDNKILERRWFDSSNYQNQIIDARQSKDSKAAEEKLLRSLMEDLFLPDWLVHSSQGDMHYQDFVQFQLSFATAFPDATYSVEDLVSEDDKVTYAVGCEAQTQDLLAESQLRVREQNWNIA